MRTAIITVLMIFFASVAFAGNGTNSSAQTSQIKTQSQTKNQTKSQVKAQTRTQSKQMKQVRTNR